MQPRSEAERIAVLESKFDDIKAQNTIISADIKVLSTNVSQILDAKIGDHAKIEAQIEAIEKSVTQLERTRNTWSFLSPTFSAVVSAIMTFLVISYFQHIR